MIRHTVQNTNTESLNRAIQQVREYNEEKHILTGKQPSVYTHTYGCQQNVADGEVTDGLFLEMGYTFASTPEEADVVLYNTCAIREGAEDRVFGNIGALKYAKEQNPAMVIGLYGCMVQQEHVLNRIRTSYPFVDLVFGAGAMDSLPELLYRRLSGTKRVFEVNNPTKPIREGLPIHRGDNFKASVPIIAGCDNFCTYCVVPLVRGRERSREPEDILADVRSLVQDGYKEITLLGQNVNSYGKTLEQPISFPELLQAVCQIPGDFQVKFMTSHPKDCSQALLDVVATEEKMVKFLHLPVQSGSNRVLKAMNRHYTVEQYRSLLAYARRRYPNLAITSDIIVGFPGETYEEFKETLALVQEANYDSLYTFLYSPREGTKAATMEDPVSLEEKKKWFQELLDVQKTISQHKHQAMIGGTYRILVEGPSKRNPGYLTGRSYSNVTVDFAGPKELIGTFVDILVTEAFHWAVAGDVIALESNKNK